MTGDGGAWVAQIQSAERGRGGAAATGPAVVCVCLGLLKAVTGGYVSVGFNNQHRTEQLRNDNGRRRREITSITREDPRWVVKSSEVRA